MTTELQSAESGAALSGLGLPSMPRQQHVNILDGAFRCLRPGAAFYQFTYCIRCPTRQGRLGLEARRLRFVTPAPFTEPMAMRSGAL